MQVAVLGAGTMGHGIAQVSATAGHDVVVRDIEEERVEAGLDHIESNLAGGVERDKLTPEEKAATLDRVGATTDLAAAVDGADLVVEAVPERPDLKKSVLSEAESLAPADATIASNTSSLSVTDLGSALEDPARFCGLHFFNPVHIMPLVEVVVAERTAERTHEFAVEFVEDVDKTPVVVHDAPGFASSRLGVTLGAEAMRMYQQGVASAEDIDAAMELGYNHPMGPLELTDVVGLDVRLDVLEYLREELGERFRPPQVLKRKVRAGKLGKKAGEGFYLWDGGAKVGVSADGGAR
jgi:3-hydroxybutyryl-CoA dehydrogenase